MFEYLGKLDIHIEYAVGNNTCIFEGQCEKSLAFLGYLLSSIKTIHYDSKVNLWLFGLL